MDRSIHVIGAGLAGLAAAIRLTQRGEQVVLYEATAQAGGRCRSFFDHTLDMTIDNGNHLVLSANHAALAFLKAVGAEDKLVGPERAIFPFFDVATGRRWTLDLGSGRIPWWLFDSARRVPDTGLFDYLATLPLLFASSGKTIGETVRCEGALYDRLMQPLLLAALNVDPKEGSAALAGQIIKETLLAGGHACRPLIAREGLTSAFVDPAVAFLKSNGVAVHFERQLHKFVLGQGQASALQFGGETVDLGPDDRVVLAVPFWIAAGLLPDLTAPTETRAIVNAHFKIAPGPQVPPITGVVNGTTEWVFAFPDRLSVTISNADRLINVPREGLARQIWREVAAAVGIAADLPPWQIVRERRATFASTPSEDAKRPGPRTAWSNVFLAGDWTATGLPATIEGSIRSGNRAADAVPPKHEKLGD